MGLQYCSSTYMLATSMALADNLRLDVGPSNRLRTQTLMMARLQAANLLKLREGQVADLIRQIEEDPLFQQMLYPATPEWKLLRFQPHPRTRLNAGFFEMSENALPAGLPPEASSVLEEYRDVISHIHRMGVELFERHFLRVEEAKSPREVADICGISEEVVGRMRDFLLAFSVSAEFFDPSTLMRPEASTSLRVTRLARLGLTPEGEVTFEFTSPHLARGRYAIDYDRLEKLTRSQKLSPEKARHLKSYLRRLELINWRQNTLFRILDRLTFLQRRFIASGDAATHSAVTQRDMARTLSVAPSTVNRAVNGRSLVLPSGEEVLLENLFCSRKNLCLAALEALEAADATFVDKPDHEWQAALEKQLGLTVPRRTINSYRRAMG